MSALAIVAFFVALIAIILIHEFGHYLTARAYGFRVLEYFVGFGPKLWSFRRGEIEYGVKAIPAGGYVKIAGMDPFNDDVPPGDEHRAYAAKPMWQRALVILAGPMSHFLVAGLIFAALLFFVGDGSARPGGRRSRRRSGAPHRRPSPRACARATRSCASATCRTPHGMRSAPTSRRTPDSRSRSPSSATGGRST